jgi:hypothetical protein
MTAPNDFAQTSDCFPLHGGRRPYMTRSGQRGADLVLANPLSCLLVRGSGPVVGSAAILATLACSEASRSES